MRACRVSLVRQRAFSTPERTWRSSFSPSARLTAGASRDYERALPEPPRVHVEEAARRTAEALDAPTGIVTIVEVLSPSNKSPRSAGRDLYLAKQKEVLAAGVSLVEIDLTRSGRRSVLSVLSEWIPMSHRTTYQVCVRRAWKLSKFEHDEISRNNCCPGSHTSRS